MTDYISAADAALFGPSMRMGIFWRLDTDPAAHLWMGLHNVTASMPAVDPSGTVYIGAGKLLSIPELETLVNGVADRVEFYLSGVDKENFDNLLNGIPKVKGKTCVVGVAPLDERYQLLTDIIPIWTGKADFWQASEKPVTDPQKNSVLTLSLSVGSGNTGRARSKALSWTDADHRSAHPTDAFFTRVSRYVRQYMVTWPRF